MERKSVIYFIFSLSLILISPRFLVISIPDANVIDFILAFVIVFFSYFFLSMGISESI
tara:strand:- start:138 stop:311 length:174 start_codon:yes stop_codon:yes gene_type:complete